MLDRIPTVLTAQEILDKAFLRANKLEVPDPDKYHRIRKTQEVQMRCITDVCCEALDRQHRAWPTIDDMRAYEREVIDIFSGVERVRKSLSSIHWARDKIRDVYAQSAERMRRQRTIDGILAAKRGCSGRIASLMADVDGALTVLRETRDKIRLLPSVHPGHFTVVLAGFPNVGKSSLLGAITTARPEVAQYAFTTKAAIVGHLEIPGEAAGQVDKIQFVDTPGLLDRPDEERNLVERQAAAALRHVADLVLFLIDPSETSGFSMKEQEALLAHVQAELEGVPMLVVESKADLLPDRESDHLRISTATGDGLQELKTAVLDALPTEEPILDEDPLDAWRDARREV